MVTNTSDRDICLAVQDQTREMTMTIEIKYFTMIWVTPRGETSSNQTEEEDVLLTVGYFDIVRLN